MGRQNHKVLSQQEKILRREETIKLFMSEQISVEEAMVLLKLSRSSIYRLCSRYAQGGKQALMWDTKNGPLGLVEKGLKSSTF